MSLRHNACSRELLQSFSRISRARRAAAMVSLVFCIAELSLMMAESLSSRLAYCKASLQELVTDELITLMPFEPPLLYIRGSLIHIGIKQAEKGRKKRKKKKKGKKIKKSFTSMSFQSTKVMAGPDAGYSSAQGSKGLWRADCEQFRLL